MSGGLVSEQSALHRAVPSGTGGFIDVLPLLVNRYLSVTYAPMNELKPLTVRRRLTKSERRKAIVDAARESFFQNGYAGTSMSGLLKVLGGSKATLWAYFRSKEELFAAVVQPAISSMWVDASEDLNSRESLETALSGFCRRFMEINQQPDSVALWRLIAAESGRFPEVGRIFREHAVSVAENMLVAYLGEAVDRGLLRHGDCLDMARIILSLCTSRLDRMLWNDPAEVMKVSAEHEAVWITTVFLRAFEASRATEPPQAR